MTAPLLKRFRHEIGDEESVCADAALSALGCRQRIPDQASLECQYGQRHRLLVLGPMRLHPRRGLNRSGAEKILKEKADESWSEATERSHSS